MNKILSLLRANMSEGMNIFKINTKKKNTISKVLLPVFLCFTMMSMMYSYAQLTIEQLEPVNMQFVVLSLFIITTSILTIIEGIYKTGSLLFNCKDDNLLFSLPIGKSTVLFLRIFKFYIFELMYNSIFLLPAMIVYAVHTNPGITYYVVSLIGVLLFPIIPILMSCIIGSIITFVSSNFKGKNIMQTLITIIILLGVLYFSFNTNQLISNLAQNASNINNVITKMYYPARAFIELVLNFSIIKLVKFIVIHLGLAFITIALIGKIYFNINSNIKLIKLGKKEKNYKIKTNTQINALIKKEFNRFINSTVFVTNAFFGIIIFIIGCIAISIKFDSLAESVIQTLPVLTLDNIYGFIPILLFGFVCISCFMTSITSSMISLEGRSINLLKSLPIKPYTIVTSKVLTALLAMIPFIILGDIVIFIRFKFDLLNILLILIASFVLPLLSETIGIIVNLKYPKLDAKNDTEVVKQSMSSAISVFIGMAFVAATIVLLFKALQTGISNSLIILIFTIVYGLVYLILQIYLYKTCNKSFDNISC